MRQFAIVTMVLLFAFAFASAACAEGRGIKDLDAPEIVQPDFVKAKTAEQCPEGTAFTMETNRGVWCRVCPDGFMYSTEARICAKCPAGTTFVPPYKMAGRRYNLGGLCAKYSAQ